MADLKLGNKDIQWGPEENAAFEWAHLPENDGAPEALELRKMAKDTNWKSAMISPNPIFPSNPLGTPTDVVTDVPERVDESGYNKVKDFFTTPQDEALKSYAGGYIEGVTMGANKAALAISMSAAKNLGPYLGFKDEDIKDFNEIMSEIKDFDKEAKHVYPVFNNLGKMLGYVTPWGIAIKGYGFIRGGTNFLAKLTQKLTPKMIESVGKVAGSALSEGAAAGVLTRAGNAMESYGESGDPKKIAEEFFKNIGPNEILGAGLGAFQTGVPIAAAKVRKIMPKMWSSLRNISPEVTTIYSNPKERKVVDEMIAQYSNPGSRVDLLEGLRTSANSELSGFVEARNRTIKEVLAQNNKQINLTPISEKVTKLLSDLRGIEIKDKLIRNAISELDAYAQEFIVKGKPSKILSSSGSPAIPAMDRVKETDLIQLDAMRKRLNDLSSAIHKQTDIKLPPLLAKNYERLASEVRGLIIRGLGGSSKAAKTYGKSLSELRDLAKLQNKANLDSVYSDEGPVSGMDKLIAGARKWGLLQEKGIEQMATLEKIDKMIGGSISQNAKRYLAAKQLSNMDLLSGFLTGRSLVAVTGAAAGGPVGAALGTLWWLHTAPITSRPLIRGYSRATQGVSGAYDFMNTGKLLGLPVGGSKGADAAKVLFYGKSVDQEMKRRERRNMLRP